MALILTFLGKGGTGCSTIAVAAAKQLSAQGKRVLFATQDPSPAIDLLLEIPLETPLTADPQPVAGNFQAVKLYATTLLERSWEEMKTLEAQYLRSPFFRAVFGQELGILPGMDSALALNAIREFENSGSYDVIVYDGTGDLATLRVLGMPEILSWYIRRFRQVFADSDLGKTISPFVQPIAGAVLNVNWTSGDIFNQPAASQVNNLLEEGRNAVADPNRVIAYLVTNDDPGSVATAQYLWGSAQQVGLTIGGVLLNQAQSVEPVESTFAPLTVRSIPKREGDWQSVMSALPDFTQATNAPRPIRVDTAERKVYLFLPGFDKKQVKLTQYGPEVTIEAGDQRRNIFLPPQLSGKPVTGAKFQDGYLIISF